MNVESDRGPEALNHGHGAGFEVAANLALARPAAKIAGDGGDEAAEHGGGQVRRVGHAESKTDRDTEHELPNGDLWEKVVDTEGCGVGHPASEAETKEESVPGTGLEPVRRFRDSGF